MTFWDLLPSRDNKRFLVCKACGGHYDLTNGNKMMSILAGMIGLAVAMAGPFQWIVNAGHASKGSIAAGIAVAGLSIGAFSIAAARLGLQLEIKR
jgi:hypothetical protein